MRTRDMVLAGLFATLLVVGAYVSIPIGVVPHTLQVFFILLTGFILGSRLGTMSVAVWILLGVFGLPVFAQGKAGAIVLIGPTGGFIFGMLLCTYLVGRLTQYRTNSYGQIVIVMLTGVTTIYILGMLGFMMSFTYFLHKPMTWEVALGLVVVPFLPFDIVKALIAAYVGQKIRRALERAGLQVAR